MILRPPVPEPPEHPLSVSAFLRAVGTNALTIWPRAAYEQDFVSRNFLGRVNILLNTPDAIQHVLISNAMNYRRSRASVRILRPITGRGLLLSENENWKLQRRTIAPSLGPRMMPMLASHVMHAANVAVDRIRVGMSHPIDLLASMQGVALDIAGRSMFSLEMDQYGPAIRRLLGEFATNHAHPGLLDLLLPPGIPTPADFARKRFGQRWMALIDAILTARLREPVPEQPRDLLDLLRAARDPETGAAFSSTDLRDQVATLILAGHETTAVALFWAVMLLAQSPSEQEIVANEVRNLTFDPETIVTEIPGLVHTRAVVNETLRLFPPAFTIVREAIAADRIGKINVPARTVVMIAPWVLHRHHALWKEPDAFLPSRFLPDQPQPARFAFMPFGAGPRVCVGAQFAMTEVILVLAAIIARFHVSSTGSVLPVAVITTQPDHAALVNFRPRDQ